jgi:uncharacterized protein (TIGR04255 family)
VSEFPKLKNPPIREAVITIGIQPFLVGDKSIFEPLRKEIESHLPIVEELNTQTIHFGLEGEIGETEHTFQGLIFKSSDEKTVVQCRMDGFTLNRLAPYTDWEDVFPKAMLYWESYQTIFKPQSISNVSVRYINELTLISTPSTLSDYLTIAPQLVPIDIDEKGSIYQFINQQGIRLDTSEIFANLILAFEGNIQEGRPVIILDIECSHINATGLLEAKNLQTTFDKLRIIKNKIFYASITDKAKELYL